MPGGRPKIKWDEDFTVPGSSKEPHVTTLWKNLEKLLSTGATLIQCHAVLNVSIESIEVEVKRRTGMSFLDFRTLKEETGIRLNFKNAFMNKALIGKDSACLIFGMKNLFGWTDKVQSTNTNLNFEGGEVEINLRWADDEENNQSPIAIPDTATEENS